MKGPLRSVVNDIMPSGGRGHSPFIPPYLPCNLRTSLSAIAAPCRTSHAALKRSTSSSLTNPSHTQWPDWTSSALDLLSVFGATAPPFEGSMITRSCAGPSAGDFGLSTRCFGVGWSSEPTRRALAIVSRFPHSVRVGLLRLARSSGLVLRVRALWWGRRGDDCCIPWFPLTLQPVAFACGES